MRGWLIIAGALLLAGCGGGGGGGGIGETPAPPATPPVTQEEFTAATGTFAGTVDFDAGFAEALTLGYSRDPGRLSGDQLNGQAYRRLPDGSLQIYTALFDQYARGVVTSDGERTRIRRSIMPGDLNDATDYYFTTGPVQIHRFTDGIEASTATTTGALPRAGRVGDSGPFYTFRTVDDSGHEISTGTVTWSIAADTPTTVFACLTTVERETGSSSDVTAVECYQATETGHFTSRMRLKLSADGRTIAFNKDN